MFDNFFERVYTQFIAGDGIVEQLVTMGSPSATAMHNKIWPQVQPEAETYLMDQLYRRAERVLILAAEKRARA